jgi:hypothetical protein
MMRMTMRTKTTRTERIVRVAVARGACSKRCCRPGRKSSRAQQARRKQAPCIEAGTLRVPRALLWACAMRTFAMCS